MRLTTKWLLVLLFSIISHMACAADIDQLVQRLGKGSLTEKEQIINQLITTNEPKGTLILQALSRGDLYWHKKQQIITIKDNTQFRVWNTLQPIEASKNQFKRIAINHHIRHQLKRYQLQMRLDNSSALVRRLAAQELFGELSTPEQTQMVLTKLTNEQDSQVKRYLIQALAFAKLDENSTESQIVALSQLSEVTHSQFVQKLHQLSRGDNAPLVKQKAQQLLDHIEQQKSVYAIIEQIYFGLSLGSILILAAIGLAITFGVMGVINMAHGELIMIGAYTTYVIQQLLSGYPGCALLLSIPAAFCISGAMGMVIERGVIRFLYGRPLETLLATFGISLLLQQLIRTLFSPLNKAIMAPEWMQGTIQVNDFLSLTVNRLYILAFSLIIFFILLLIMKKTRLGLNVRAISLNPLMARSLGVKADWNNALTFGLGSGIAGLAGVALSQITNVGPNLGQNYIIDSFMVVVVGGVGNLWGTFISGLSLGLINKFIEPIAGAMLAKIVILVGLVLFIQKRPRGLFPQRGRAVEN